MQADLLVKGAFGWGPPPAAPCPARCRIEPARTAVSRPHQGGLIKSPSPLPRTLLSALHGSGAPPRPAPCRTVRTGQSCAREWSAPHPRASGPAPLPDCPGRTVLRALSAPGPLPAPAVWGPLPPAPRRCPAVQRPVRCGQSPRTAVVPRLGGRRERMARSSSNRARPGPHRAPPKKIARQMGALVRFSGSEASVSNWRTIVRQLGTNSTSATLRDA